MSLPLMMLLLFVLVAATVIAAGLLYGRWAGEEQLPSEAVDFGGNAGSLSWPVVLAAAGKLVPSPKGDALRILLFRAGYRAPGAVLEFQGLQAVAGITIALLLSATILLVGDGTLSPLVPVAGFGVGFLGPKLLLEYQKGRRSRNLRSAVPPALDLMVLALEAGQTIDQGIQEAARTVNRVYPDLAAELNFCSLEMRGHASQRSVPPDGRTVRRGRSSQTRQRARRR
jgi:Flp pilus assembly protein TadB